MINRLGFEEGNSVQNHLALRLASCLGESASTLSHEVTERLRVSRELAQQHALLARQRLAALAPSPSVLSGGINGAALLGAPTGWFFRFASGMPLLVLLLGLLFIQQWTGREQVLAAAEIDSMLLADELPVRAYADPGFAEFLRVSPP